MLVYSDIAFDVIIFLFFFEKICKFSKIGSTKLLFVILSKRERRGLS